MIELLNCGFFSYGRDDTKENQDSILPPSKLGNGYIFAIADGVGSYKGAKLASQIAINHLSKMVLDHDIDIDIDSLFSTIKDEIFKISDENPDLYHSATTLTFCYVNNDSVNIGHIGDTRIYVKNKNKLIQLSKDHTVHQSLLDEKIYTKKELKNIKGKNKLTTAISRIVELQYQKLCYPVSELIENNGLLNLYIMSDGAHHFWEKRPRFSIETLKNPIHFASSLQRRINKNTSIDDHSLIAVTFLPKSQLA